MKCSPDPSRRGANAFTLLELVLAMAIFAMISAMVFGIAGTSLSLSNTIIKTQNEEMLHHAFFEMLGKQFAQLPGNARLELTYEDSGGPYLSDLTMQNVPLTFSWAGAERTAKAVQISTILRRSGFLSIVLRYYGEEILEGSESATNAVKPEPFAEIELLSDVRYFEWRMLDGQSMEWLYDWTLVGRLPRQMELVMAYGAQGEEMRRVFWIPPKQNPEVMLRQMAMGQQDSGGGGARPGGGGGEVTVPTDPGQAQPPVPTE